MATVRALLPIGSAKEPNPKIGLLRRRGFAGGNYDRGDGYTAMNIEVFGEPAIRELLADLAAMRITGWRM